MRDRSRAWAYAVLIATLVLVMGAQVALADDSANAYGLGLRPTTGDVPMADVSMHAHALKALPSSVDLRAGMPPIGNQGSQNSCVGWAVGYYYKTYQEWQERGWSLTDSNHQFSPSFVYNQRSGDCTNDGGMTMPAGLGVIVDKGALSIADFPYYSYSSCAQPSASQLEDAAEFKAESYGAIFWGAGNGDVEVLKSYLADGEPFLLSVPVYSNFYAATYNNPVVDSPSTSDTLKGGHAMFVVGYDDAMGGFLTANSWGAYWVQNGYCYLSYDFVSDYVWEAWVMVDEVTQTQTDPTPTPTNTPVPAPTNTPVPAPTNTPVPKPTYTPAPTSTPNPVVFGQINLTEGWNLVSLPVVPLGSNIADIVEPAGRIVSAVYAHDATTGQWMRYFPNAPAFTNSLANVNSQTGLWVLANQSVSINVGGVARQGDSIALHEGWNLVAYPGTESRAVAQGTTSLGDALIEVSGYSNGDWLTYTAADPGAATLSTLEPGVGYWVCVSQATTWTAP